MQNIFYHIDHPFLLSRCICHNDFGPTHAVRTEVIYPVEKAVPAAEKARAPQPACYPVVRPEEHEYIWWQDTLVFFKRDGLTLVIEPDSANWMVMNSRYFSLFELMKRPGPSGYVLYNPYFSKEESVQFLLQCVAFNFIRLENNLTMFEPLEVTPLPYVDHFSFELSRKEGDTVEHMSEKVASRAVSLLFESPQEETFWLELLSADPRGDRELISLVMKIIDQERTKSFQKIETLLHAPCEEIDRTVSAFLDWNGIIVRGYIHSADDLGKDSVVTGLRELRAHDILESISVPISGPDDFSSLEFFLTQEKMIKVRLAFSPDVESVTPSARDNYSAVLSERSVKMLEYLQEQCAHRDDCKLHGVYPLTTLISHLVHTDREISCTQKPYSGSRIFVDFNGTVISPGSTAGKKSAVKVTSSKEKLRAVMAAASGSSRRAEKCALCTFRNFCTGLCKGKPGEALTKKDEELYCAYIANVVQELMWNIDRKKELLSFVQ